jgi:hypothetical protein
MISPFFLKIPLTNALYYKKFFKTIDNRKFYNNLLYSCKITLNMIYSRRIISKWKGYKYEQYRK